MDERSGTSAPDGGENRGRGGSRGGGLQILVVDGNGLFAWALSRVLARGRDVVEVAIDGATAIVAARHQTPDVVLFDLRLPGDGGPDLVAALRRLPTCDATIFLAMSGIPEPRLSELARTAGVDAVLPKPLDYGRLQRILTVLRRRQQESGPGR